MNYVYSSFTQGFGDARMGEETGGDPNALGMTFQCRDRRLFGNRPSLALLAPAYYLGSRHCVGSRRHSPNAVAGGNSGLGRHGRHGPVHDVQHFSSFLKRIVIVGIFAFVLSIFAWPLAQDYLLPRIQRAVAAYSAGDLTRATGGRSELLYVYLQRAMSSNFCGAGFDYSSVSSQLGTSKLRITHGRRSFRISAFSGSDCS